MRNKIFVVSQHFALAAFLVVLQPGAAGQTTGQATNRSSASVSSDDGWQVQAIPYLWFSGLDGDVTVANRPIPVSRSFLDILDATDSLLAFEGYFDARKGKWGFFSDVMLIKLGVDGIVFEDGLIDVTNRLNVVEFGGLYRLAGSPSVADRSPALDVVVGGRSSFLGVKTKLNEIEGVVGERDLTDNSYRWVEPIVGLRTNAPLSRRVSFAAEGSVGGFGAGSDFSWKALGAISFNLSEGFRILGGYRALGNNYENEDEAFKWDMILHGPIVGFGFTF